MTVIVQTVQSMRQTLLAEGVFSSADSVDEPTLRMFWNARRSPEYRRRLAELMPDR